MNVYLWDLYKEVEYIQSSGIPTINWQVIDTLYIPTPNTKISIDIQFTSVASQAWLFWTTISWGNYLSMIAYISWSLQWSRYMMDWTSNTPTNVSADTNRHTFILDKSWFTILTNWSQIYYGANPYTPTKNWYNSLVLLWSHNSDNTYWNYASAKLYSCKIYESWTLVRDFVPCYRLSNNVIWLFDKVENKFYTNVGTGSFSKWSDVKTFQPSLLNAYIWANYITETYNPSSEDTQVSIYKSWYKIKSITVEWEANYSSTAWVTQWLVIWHNWDNSFRVYSSIPMWPQRWYDYNNEVSPYWWITWRDNNWFIAIPWLTKMSSTTTTKNNTAITWTLTEDSISYKAWQYYWTWLQEESTWLTSTISNLVKNMFESSSAVIWYYGGANFTKHLFTVTYEPV